MDANSEQVIVDLLYPQTHRCACCRDLKPVCRHQQKYPEVASPWLPNQFGHAASMLGKNLTENAIKQFAHFLITKCSCLESEFSDILLLSFLFCASVKVTGGEQPLSYVQ
jgi:hypothetical protein